MDLLVCPAAGPCLAYAVQIVAAFTSLTSQPAKGTNTIHKPLWWMTLPSADFSRGLVISDRGVQGWAHQASAPGSFQPLLLVLLLLEHMHKLFLVDTDHNDGSKTNAAAKVFSPTLPSRTLQYLSRQGLGEMDMQHAQGTAISNLSSASSPRLGLKARRLFGKRVLHTAASDKCRTNAGLW